MLEPDGSACPLLNASPIPASGNESRKIPATGRNTQSAIFLPTRPAASAAEVSIVELPIIDIAPPGVNPESAPLHAPVDPAAAPR